MTDGREIQQTLCRMCDDRCGIDVTLEGRPHRRHRREPRPSLESRTALRQGSRRRGHGLSSGPHPHATEADRRRVAGDPARAGARRDRRAAGGDRRAARTPQRQRLEGRGDRLRPAGESGASLRPRLRESQLSLQRFHVLRGTLLRLQARRRGVADPRSGECPLHRPVGSEPSLCAPEHDAVHHRRAPQGCDPGGGRSAALGDRAPRRHPRRPASRHRRRPGLGARSTS